MSKTPDFPLEMAKFAELTATYYNHLVLNNVPIEIAALLTNAYVSTLVSATFQNQAMANKAALRDYVIEIVKAIHQ